MAIRAITSRNITAAPDANSTTSGVSVRACWRTIASGAISAAAPRLTSRPRPDARSVIPEGWVSADIDGCNAAAPSSR